FLRLGDNLAVEVAGAKGAGTEPGLDGVELIADLGPPRLVVVDLHLHVVRRADDLRERRQLTERIRVGHAHVRARKAAAGLRPELPGADGLSLTELFEAGAGETGGARSDRAPRDGHAQILGELGGLVDL